MSLTAFMDSSNPYPVKMSKVRMNVRIISFQLLPCVSVHESWPRISQY